MGNTFIEVVISLALGGPGLVGPGAAIPWWPGSCGPWKVVQTDHLLGTPWSGIGKPFSDSIPLSFSLLLIRAKVARIFFCHYLGRIYHTISLEITLGFLVAHIKLLTWDWHIVDWSVSFYHLGAANPHLYDLLWWYFSCRCRAFYLTGYIYLIFDSIFQAILIFLSSESAPVSLIFFLSVSPENLHIHSLPLSNLLLHKLSNPEP